MGKVKPRLLGNEEVEEKQKKEQKAKAMEKKMLKKKDIVGVDHDRPVVIKPPNPLKTPKSPKAKAVSIKPCGKHYQEAKKMIDGNKYYSLKEAISLLKKMKLVNFDQSVELHFVADETGLKGEIELPFSTGKIVRVKIVDDSILSDLEKGKIEFDVLVTHPSFMPKLAKFAKVLGPKGLMPNPKAGTVSTKPEEVVKKFEKGMLRWKTEAKFPLIHQMIGKISFEEKNLLANAEKFFEAVGKTHIKDAFIKTTMSPVVKLEMSK
ncbi:MAG: 50S ribosomal protein L1 [Candidatus Gottesmanbacteria bacterium GW2011_GWA2_44_17]|uniref:Large ribosomal subunit protein uL1 n=1 Tax=Candidatus Gottesmanbacteria bacterium GW2011_GWA2_44_17 TaxID=1618444 RepID=A0A0G1JVP2_9BACT|nr:MAG: 50S ribosomal protein L1 [Candidatus Gottesmanbacteria bacterium GW2011_GWA2_44_17]